MMVTDAARAAVANAALNKVIDLSARLPASPFVRKAPNFSFCEFETFCALDFGGIFRRLSARYADETIYGMGLVDPLGRDYYRENYDFYGAFEIPASEIVGGYREALEYEPAGDLTGSLQFTPGVLCVAGSSADWAFWGERGRGVAVGWTADADVSWRDDADGFVSLREAVRSFVEPALGANLSATFVPRFLQTFGAGGA